MLTIELSQRDPRPVYLQIADGVRAAAARGLIQEGESLPPVRGLADYLGVHPNTVLQAYQELARAGIVASYRGRGTFLRSGALSHAERRAMAEAVAMRALSDAHRHGVSLDDLISALERAEAPMPDS